LYGKCDENPSVEIVSRARLRLNLLDLKQVNRMRVISAGKFAAFVGVALCAAANLYAQSIFSSNFENAVYYVSTSGSDISGNGSANLPWKSFSKGFSAMVSGDTLVLKDGTYSELMGAPIQPPSGQMGARTIIRAEHDGGAVVDGAGVQAPLTVTNSYIRIEGLKFINGKEQVGLLDGNQLEIVRTAFGNAGSGQYDDLLNVNGNNVLIEDAWLWGRGKAGIIAYGSGHVFRRVVVRLDGYSGPSANLGYVGFVLYDTFDAIIENCIALDFAASATTFDWKGGFRSRDQGDTRSQRFYGDIALNVLYDGFRLSDTHVENVVAWDVNGRGGIFEDTFKSGFGIKNATVGASASGGINTYLTPVSNSLIYHVTGASTGGNYNHFFNTATPVGATNALIANPQIRYLTRVELGSPGYASGQGGASRGATVVNRYQNGVLTTQPLWPWPNEARIKADFQTNFNLPGINPRRGFAADGNGLRGTPITLTSYIWEYLGNPCPIDICP
jgi:hypothetical protein